MTTPLTLRSDKGSPLTHDEVDANFSGLRATADGADTAAAAAQATADGAVVRSGDTMTGPLTIAGGVLTASTPALNISQEWNDSGVAFNAFKVDVTPTAQSNGSALATFGYSGTPVFGWYRYGGMVTIGAELNANGAPNHGFMSDAGLVVFGNNSNPHAGSTARAFIVRSPDTLFNQNGVIRFGDNWASYSSDIGIGRNAAGVLEVNNSTLGTLRDLIARNTITPGVTAASLAGAQQGARSFVTDSTVAAAGNFGAVVAGGGANAVPVYYDGTNWRIG